MLKDGKKFKFEKGVYSDNENVNYLEIINKKYPNAIFTMESAFYYLINTKDFDKKRFYNYLDKLIFRDNLIDEKTLRM